MVGIPEKTATFVFDEYPDVEVELRLRPVPLSEFLALAEMIEEPDRLGSAGAIRELVESFARLALVRWNLPEPATLEGLRAQDISFVMALAVAWVREVANLPAPLARSSPNGSTSTTARPQRRSRARA